MRCHYRHLPVWLGLMAAGGPLAASQAPAPATPAAIQGVAPRAAQIAHLARLIEARYLFPDIAARYAAMLRSNAASGRYEDLDDAAFARRLTEDLQAVSPDAHLRVMARGANGSGPAGGAGLLNRRTIEQAVRLTPDIAYLRLGFMSPDPAIVAEIVTFVRANADARTFIFDLRTNIGGTPNILNAVLPFFFGTRTMVSNVEIRDGLPGARQAPPDPENQRLDAPPGMIRTARFVTPQPDERRLYGATVYLLTSTRTGSAAEGFGFAFQRTGRGTTVGEATYGAGHFGGIVPIDERLAVFIPFGRPYDPATNLGWEGTGVVPRIAVPAERALAEALVRSGVTEAEASRLAESVAADPAEMRPSRPPARLAQAPR